MHILIAALLMAFPIQDGRRDATSAEAGSAQALFSQTYANWHVPCDTPGAETARVVIDVELNATGRFAREPVLVSPEDTPVYRIAAASALTALRDTAPFEVPEGFAGGRYRPIFRLDRVCANVG